MISEEFAFCGPVLTWEPFGNGHINRTLRVRCTGGEYLVQRIAPEVFPDPDAVMGNLERVLDHLAGKPSSHRLTLVPTRSGARWRRDAEGAVWRAFPFLAGTVSCERVAEPAQAHAAGRAFAAFLADLADLSGPPLETVIPRFHDTPWRLAELAAAAQDDPCGRAVEAAEEIRGILEQEQLARALPAAWPAGSLAHHDAKIGNLLFAADGRTPACVVDLDTLMPGGPITDFADLVRTASCRAAEDAEPALMVPDADLLAALAAGWLEGRGSAADDAERAQMPLAGAVIALEQAARFLTDHLRGDTYYRISHSGHNLIRARAQLALARALTARQGDIARLVSRKAIA